MNTENTAASQQPKIHVVTKDQLDGDNRYTGTVDLTQFDGSIEIEANLGRVIFTALRAVGNIFAEAGSGIEAGWGIEAVANISVRLRIFVGLVRWRLPRPEELVISCRKLTSGTVAHGTLNETGTANQEPPAAAPAE